MRIGKWRIIILAIWIVATCLSMITMPRMDQLIREKGQIQIGKEHASGMASKLLKGFNGNHHDSNVVETMAVFHSPRGLSPLQIDEIKKMLHHLDKKKLKIRSLMTPFDNQETWEKLISRDRTTAMTMIVIEKGDQTISDLRSRLSRAMKVEDVQTYLTGKDFINEDFIQTSIHSVKSTETVTIFIIIAVLLLVFRSPITPFISLLTVGISYLVSLNCVLHLVDWFNFPFSNTTQIFLILVLFGIGTDYTILVLMRYKEEYIKRGSSYEALAVTYRTAGRTVFFSGLAVLIGFGMVGFSRFAIFQSAVAVSIGIFILLLVIFTIVPVLIASFGRYLFWPVGERTGAQTSRIWGWLGTLSMKRSLASLCIILVISLPGLFFHRGDLSFNSMKEINKDNQSIQGANIVAGSFGKGETMPTTAVITTIKPLDSPQGLAFIDDVHQRLQDIQGVVKVYGPTRPLGQRIDKFYYNEQAKEMNIGLERSVKGLNHVSLGLQKASTNIPDSSTGGFSNITRLVRGTSAIMGHLAQTQKALATIQLGLKAGANQSTTLLKGAHQLEENLKIISARTEQLYEGYQQIAQTFTLMNQEYVLLAEQVAAIKGTADEIAALSNLLDPSNDVGNQIKVKAGTLRQQVSSLEDRLVKVHDPFTTTVNLLNQANAQLKVITDVNKQMAQGASEITQGVEALSLGMKQGAKGEELIAGGLSKVQGGLQSVNDGQKGLHKKISRFSSRLGELKQGLHKSAQGVDHISTGINQANRYLSQVSHQGPPALFIPKEVREGKEFRDALNMYMANDRKSVKWMITLDADPYSEKAMGIAKKIQDTMRRIKSENNAILEQGVGGISSINVDLHRISSRDFLQAFILMFAGIGVYLLFLFRSSWITLSTLISLIVAYYSSLSITERIFINGLGEDGLSWTVPFLSFVMLIALGVDYSIFLVMRFKEYHEMKPLPAIEKAVTFTGRAVISAMIILSGTCASLYPSGVNTLMQIATVVIIGLVLLTLLLPLLVPLVIKVREMLKRKSSN